MLLNLIRWLRGYVVFEITGKFPERFINVCVHQGRFVFDAVPSGGSFRASLLLSDYRSIRPLARRSRVKLRIKERHGLPFLLSRYRARKGLFYGALAFVFVILFMQNFVWTIEVNGLKTLSATAIESKLEEKGLFVGAFKGKKNLHNIERSIMQEVEEISWMSVNLIGTKAEVEIKEKELKPHIVEAQIPCNVKAGSDGVIISMDIRMGSTEIPVGSAVKEGQLIVSGVLKNSLDNISFVHADAKVLAQTNKTKVITCKKSESAKIPSDVKVRKNLDLFWLSIPYSFSSVAGDYTATSQENRIKLNNTFIPVGVTSQTCTLYEERDITYSKTEAQTFLKADEALYRLFHLKDCEEIKTSYTMTENKDFYIYEVKYECVEDIALQEKIIVN